MAMLQTELFDALVEIGEIDEADLPPVMRFGMMADAAKKISALTSASTRLKQWQSSLKDKMDKKFAELESESSKQGSTLDAATLRRIRQEVYGVMS